MARERKSPAAAGGPSFPPAPWPWRRPARAALLGWAVASWVKASLALHRRAVLSRHFPGEEDKRLLALFHLAVTYLVLRFEQLYSAAASGLPGSGPPLSPPRRAADAGAGRRRAGRRRSAACAFALGTAAAMVVDEVAVLVLAQRASSARPGDGGGRRGARIAGRPAPASSTADDCCVCYGTSLGDPRGGGGSDGPLESFCKVPHHVAHHACMETWYNFTANAKCPVCRQDLELLSLSSADGGGGGGDVGADRAPLHRRVGTYLRELLLFLEPAMAMRRCLITLACAASVLLVIGEAAPPGDAAAAAAAALEARAFDGAAHTS